MEPLREPSVRMLGVEAGEIAWERFDGPEEYRPSSVLPALEAMASARTGNEAQAAYHAVLFAVGNNHGGTFYPAVVAALPLVLEMTRSGRPWTRFAAVEVAIECVTSFEPEPGFERTVLPDGRMCDVDAAVTRICGEALPRLQHQLDEERHPETRAALSELVAEVLDRILES